MKDKYLGVSGQRADFRVSAARDSFSPLARTGGAILGPYLRTGSSSERGMAVPWMTVVTLGLTLFSRDRKPWSPGSPRTESRSNQRDRPIRSRRLDRRGRPPSSTILDIVRTRDGYLWLATTRGLARFDGVRFAVFDASNRPALSSNNQRAARRS